MNLDELRAVRDDERATGELQPLRPSFYAEAREFIAEIESERNEQVDAVADPLADPTVGRLNDKLTAAREVLESIFENRASKLLTHALTVAAGEGTDPPDMTAEEAELYRVVVEAIEAKRTQAIHGDTDGSISTPAIEMPPAEPTEQPEASMPPAEAPGDDGDTELTQPDDGRILVRVVDDVGTILGVDEREYELASGDVVSLPIENAQALIEREVAVPVEGD